MRILVAYGDEHRVYREVIASGIRLLRPENAVATCTQGELGSELERFDPQVVICDLPETAEPGDRLAWIELPLETLRPTKVRIGGRHRECTHLLLEGLLELIDEAHVLTSGK
ncbi:MAG: hypothetical protein ACR2JR_05385 [Rubrobacteraceae bacterium]